MPMEPLRGRVQKVQRVQRVQRVVDCRFAAMEFIMPPVGGGRYGISFPPETWSF